MAFVDFLEHKCDIYHIKETLEKTEYGLKATEEYSYNDIPDIKAQKCHFGVRSMNISINQTEPFRTAEGSIKLSLPAGTDIRLNDKIVDCATGAEFTAEIPRNVRDHHIFVYLQRSSEQKRL